MRLHGIRAIKRTTASASCPLNAQHRERNGPEEGTWHVRAAVFAVRHRTSRVDNTIAIGILTARVYAAHRTAARSFRGRLVRGLFLNQRKSHSGPRLLDKRFWARENRSLDCYVSRWRVTMRDACRLIGPFTCVSTLRESEFYGLKLWGLWYGAAASIERVKINIVINSTGDLGGNFSGTSSKYLPIYSIGNRHYCHNILRRKQRNGSFFPSIFRC